MTYFSKEPPKEQMIPASVAAKMIEQARIQGMRKMDEYTELLRRTMDAKNHQEHLRTVIEIRDWLKSNEGYTLDKLHIADFESKYLGEDNGK